MNFTLYLIYWLAGALDGAPFDLGPLPFDIAEGVRIEAVAERFPEGTFDLWRERFGTAVVEEYREIHGDDDHVTIIMDGPRSIRD